MELKLLVHPSHNNPSRAVAGTSRYPVRYWPCIHHFNFKVLQRSWSLV